MLQEKGLCYFCALLPLSYWKVNQLSKSQIHEAVYWQDTSNPTGRRWSVCSEMSKAQKAPGNALLLTWAPIGTSPPVWHSGAQHHDPLFKQRLSVLQVSPISYHANSKKCSYYARKSNLLHKSRGVWSSNTLYNIQHFYSPTIRRFAKDGALLWR